MGPDAAMHESADRRDWFKARLLTGLGAAALVTLAIVSGLTWRADAWFYDALARASPSPADERIVVVEIDEKSLAELGRWPWSRRTHARLVDRLEAASARGVGLDVLLSEPALFDPEGDALLARALARSDRVVLPVYVEAQNRDGPVVELMPIPEFVASAASLGHVDVGLDRDGMARLAYLHAGLGSPRWPALALALSQLGSADPIATELPGLRHPEAGPASPRGWVRDNEVLVRPVSHRHGFRRVSYVDVLEGRVAPAELRGRWILVGATVPGLGAQLASPAWHAGGPRMLAVDYQASVLNMLVRGDAVAPLGLAAQLCLSVLLVVAPLLLFGLPGLRRIWQPVALAAALALLLSWVLLRWADAWLPPVPVLLVLAVGGVLALLQVLQGSRSQVQSDPLTGLANRGRFDEELAREMRLAQRSGQPLSLLLLDVDHFRRLNDDLGQDCGDGVLQALSAILRGRARRPRDLVARLGGDQFAILLPETTPQSAAAIATTIHVDLANFATRTDSPGSPPPFTTSIGIHTVREGEETTVEELFGLADAALYQAKQSGRNRSFSHAADTGVMAR
ncbi:MAG: diguanylate cyclase [Lysobacteraceae bacterium]|nr:MAG: diguanylate cyclase [Xanthomonadaceae bacterium]